MRIQQIIWESEHRNLSTLPSMAEDEPSAGIVYFVKYLENLKIKSSLKLVDIGCGKGRNTIYLAKYGFSVYAMDYIQSALGYTKQKAEKNGIIQQIHIYKAEIDKRWPFKNNFFDLAIDSFSSIDIETRKGRDIYKQEMYRTLKPGGFALIMVVSTKDEWESKLIKEHPGGEKNSTIWPQNGKFQKDYDEVELREFYKKFKIINIKEVKKKAFKLGKEYLATDYWVILKKPIK